MTKMNSHCLGNASVLVRLIQDETCKMEQIGSYSDEELQHFLTQCSIPWEAGESKVIELFCKHTVIPEFEAISFMPSGHN